MDERTDELPVSRFGKKLSRLGTAGPGSRSPVPTDASDKDVRIRKMRSAISELISSGRSELRARGPSRRPPRVKALPGDRIETAHGPMHLVDTFLEPAHHHGDTPVDRALTVDPNTVATLAIDPVFENVDFKRMLLIDTETTGLSGGTGTIPFLIGAAWFEDESLRIQQYVLTELGRESPMLHALKERIEWASCVVSYNGKSFDWPLLRSRFVMNRVKAPALPPHLDLLHCSRRVFKRRMESVRLVNMEEQVLGMTRVDDIGGAEIPGVYTTFLRGGDPQPMQGVIEHNGNDLIALAALLGWLNDHFEDVVRADDPRDHLSYARVAERAGDPKRALAFATAAAAGGGQADCTVDAHLLAARVARRGGEAAQEGQEERALLDALAASGEDTRDRQLFVRIELSKLYEHRLKNLSRAWEHAAAARELGEDARRVARLSKRIGKRNVRPKRVLATIRKLFA